MSSRFKAAPHQKLKDYGDDDSDGFSEQGGDCDDADPAVSPAEIEVVGDGVDNDCDGTAQ